MREIAIVIILVGVLRNSWIYLNNRKKKRHSHHYLASFLAYITLSAQFLITYYAIEEGIENSWNHLFKLTIAIALYGFALYWLWRHKKTIENS